MSLDYALEKFSVAQHTLATGSGRIKERLADAWIYSLNNIMPDRDFPVAHFKDEFTEHQERIISGPTGPEGTIKNYIATLSEEDAGEEVRWIIDFMHRLNGIEDEYLDMRNDNN